MDDNHLVIAFLAAQRGAIVATHDEVMIMIDRHGIFSMGIGYTDAHLLASILLDRKASLWTRDKRLRPAAKKAGASLHIPVCEPALNNDPIEIPCNNLKFIGKSDHQRGHGPRRYTRHVLHKTEYISIT
ncbi:hypothetical protein G6M02_19790 [Agrobacterium rhizogenes]|nr:hypothetical protein [Rhizobium rhizogenes]NTI30467.1 hypothetical protein [Rhizobium rhizogenes]